LSEDVSSFAAQPLIRGEGLLAAEKIGRTVTYGAIPFGKSYWTAGAGCRVCLNPPERTDELMEKVFAVNLKTIVVNQTASSLKFSFIYIFDTNQISGICCRDAMG
jgi:hypothetical protein